MGSISLSDANKERTSITNEELEQIQKMYKQLVKQVSQQSKDLSTDESASASLKRLQLNDLKKDLNRAIRELGTQLEQNISSDMDKAASAVCDDMNKWHDKIGLKLEGALANVPTQIVQMVSSGKLYEGNWSLSSAIWKDVQKTQGDINSIIAQGIALNKSAYDIAKDLEKYVDPSARKDWDWGKVYPGTKKVVDYNAQRLARTMVSHAYQQSLVSTCAKNPFVEGFIWHSAHSSRVCPICQERDGKTFSKNDLPLDHPNGMCTYEPATDDLTSISNRLADWVKGSPDAELDRWLSDLGVPFSPDASLMTKGYESLSPEQYKEWQKQNSTLSTIYRNFEQKYGVKLQNGILPTDQDRFIEEEGEWLYDLLNRYTAPYEMATNNVFNRYSYVQNAEWSKNINQYWRTGDSSFLTAYHKGGRVSAKKAEQLAQESLRGIKKTSEALDSLIADTVLSKNLTVDRWGGINSLRSLGITTDLSTGRIGHAFVTKDLDLNSIKSQVDNLIGTTMVDNGYMSASVSSSLNVFQGSDIKFTINVPKGTHAFVTENTQESEVIFGRGTKTEIVGSRVIETEAVDTWTGEKVKTQTLEIIMNLVS